MIKRKPYSLRMFEPVTKGKGFHLGVTDLAEQWRRSIRRDGGYWKGGFVINGDLEQLKEWFDLWMGYHLEERTDGNKSWEGLVWEMELRSNGITRRRSFDLMSNAVSVMYTTQTFTGVNLLDNPGWEFYSQDGDDVDFDSWVEGEGDHVTNVAAGTGAGEYNSGAAALKLTSDGSYNNNTMHSDVYCRQNVQVAAGTRHRMTVYSRRGSLDDKRPRIGVRDPNIQEWLPGCEPSNNGGTGVTHTQTGVWTFTGASEKEVLVYFYPPKGNNEVSFFDDVMLEEWGDVVLQSPWGVIDLDGTVKDDLGGDSFSINNFGRKEQVLFLENYPQDTAFDYRETFLRQYNMPVPNTSGIARTGEAQLKVTLAGYVATMNWMHERSGNGGNGELGNWIKTMVGTDYGLSPLHGGDNDDAGDCQFVKYIGSTVSTNDMTVYMKSSTDQRVWDMITELVAIGIEDPDDATVIIPATAWIDNDRIFNYGPVSRTPVKFITNKGIVNKLGDDEPANPWSIRPGVFRDWTYPSRRLATYSFLEREQDILVEEVEVREDGQVLLKTGLFDEEDLYEARASFRPIDIEPETEFLPFVED